MGNAFPLPNATPEEQAAFDEIMSSVTAAALGTANMAGNAAADSDVSYIGVEPGTYREVPDRLSREARARMDALGRMSFGAGPSTPPVSHTHYESYQYRDGEEYGVGATKSETWVIKVQKQMEQAGLLRSGDYVPGFWDKPSQDAMYELMGYANQQGKKWYTVLADILERGGVGGEGGVGGDGGDGGDGGAPELPPIEHIPEWALNALLEDAGKSYLGRGFTDQERQQFIDAWRGLENARNVQDMGATVQAFAQRSDPVAYAANKAVDVYDTILQTLTGGAV